MVPTTAQKTSKYTLHVSFFLRPIRRARSNAHHSILDSSTSWTCWDPQRGISIHGQIIPLWAKSESS
jgi:hypothetical protein